MATVFRYDVAVWSPDNVSNLKFALVRVIEYHIVRQCGICKRTV